MQQIRFANLARSRTGQMSSETAGKLIFKKYTLHVIQSCSIEILNVATPIFNILTSHRNTKSKPQMYKLHEIVNNNKDRGGGMYKGGGAMAPPKF